MTRHARVENVLFFFIIKFKLIGEMGEEWEGGKRKGGKVRNVANDIKKKEFFRDET